MWLLVCPGAGLAETAQARASDAARWVPAFSFFSGAQIREYEGSVAQFDLDDPVAPDEGSASAVFAFVGFSAEVSSPKLAGERGPRIFAHVDASLSFDSNRAVAGEGSPGPIEYPVNGAGNPLANSPEVGMLGRGTSLRAQAEPLVVSAGAGFAFEFETLGRKLRLKPSVEWLWQETTTSAALGQVISTQVAFGSPFCSQTTINGVPGGPQPCAGAFFGSSETKAFHSLGPGFEVEMDAARVGPIVLALYASGQAYRLLGNREINVTASGFLEIPEGFNPPSGELPAGVENPVTMRSTFELDPWHYRFGVGLRFRWLPE